MKEMSDTETSLEIIQSDTSFITEEIRARKGKRSVQLDRAEFGLELKSPIPKFTLPNTTPGRKNDLIT